MPHELLLQRYSSAAESTLGILLELGARHPKAPPAADRRFLCYVLEDQWQEVKVSQETRIPPGRYRLRLRRFGRFHERYSAQFPAIHIGVLELLDVPGFTDILIHCGNTDDHTAGCLLVGDVAVQNVSQRGAIEASVAAYRRIYPDIARAAATAEGAFITLQDFA